MSASYRCGDPSCIRLVTAIYCDEHREARRAAAVALAEERRARMSDPEYQAKLQAARKAAALPAQEG